MSKEVSNPGDKDAQLIVRAENLQLAERTARLKKAVKDAGGPRSVAERSGVPFGTVSAYLSGREMRAAPMAAIAAACNVSMDWLAGLSVAAAPNSAPESAAKPAELALAERPAAPSTPAQQERDLYQTIDRERLGRAARFAIRQFERHNREPSDYGIGQIVALIYDTPGASLEEFEEMIDWSMRPAR
jgi:transcriptional regulator with XRE-family HTH domain